MKKSVLLFASAFLIAAYAHADVLTCSSNRDGDASLVIKADSIIVGDIGLALSNDQGNFGPEQEISLDASYKPRAQNKGSRRYRGGQNSCGDFDVLLSAALLANGKGRMTFEQDCDSDGTGPVFVNYDCE